MTACRCQLLNVLSGDVAQDYARAHLRQDRVDGMGRPVHRCAESAVEWTEERSVSGYRQDVLVLRRLPG